jgi:undecaprenyl-diphosphatase
LNIQQSLLLGLIQGLTEFIPISSTAHLILAPQFMQMPQPSHTFDVALHAGTLAAVLVYFWRDWTLLLRGLARTVVEGRVGNDPHRRMGLLVLLACIPAAVAGVLLDNKVEHLSQPHEYPISLLVIGGATLVMGLLMGWADAYSRKSRAEKSIRGFDAGFIGLAQALAIIPGVSRSGATITAGLVTGLTREAAARFSFLMVTPVIAGAVLLKGVKLLHTGLAPADRMPFLVGILTAAISGYLCIRFLLRYLRKGSLGIFVGYRVLLGTFLIALYFYNH